MEKQLIILQNNKSEVIYEENNDLILVYIVPSLGLIGFILQLYSFIVFSHSRFKELLYKYLKIESFYLLLVCLNASFKPIFHCGSCKISKTYFSQLYFIIFIEFTSSILEFTAIINRILSSFCCFMLLYNKIQKKTNFIMFYYPKIINLIIVVLGGTIFSLKIFSYKIVKKYVKIKNSNKTELQFKFIYSNFSMGPLKNAFEISAFVFRDGFSLLILIVLNILILKCLKKNLSRKRVLFMPSNAKTKCTTHQNESFNMGISYFNNLNKQSIKNKRPSNLVRIKNCESKHLLIVLISCINFIIGRIPIMIYFILKNLKSENIFLLKGAVITVYLSYNFNFFLYFFTNKRFRRVYKQKILNCNS